MLGKLKKAFGVEKKVYKIFAPIDGAVVPVSEVNDPAFSEEVLGKGVALKPSNGRLVSPVNGTVSQMFDTCHAVSITSEDGIGILIHIGLDTVRLKGECFTTLARTGDSVKIGDVLIEFDKNGIVSAGYDIITPVIVCNPGDYKAIEVQTGRNVKAGEELILLRG